MSIPKVRAIDLGWGYTKYSKVDENGKVEFAAFPSLAPKSVGMDLSSSILGRRNTVTVKVDGTEYEVGPDSGDLDSNDTTRNLNDMFIFTDQYKAVFFGALHYMGTPEIDLLVVGLPISNMGAAEKLKASMLGEHKITDKRTVTVKDVLVLAQPMGALYYCLGSKKELGLEYMDNDMNLIVDPGFLTFDFLLANGQKIVETRSGAHPAGVSKVLRAISESISTKHGIRYENLTAIDRGLRRRKIKINGTEEDLEPHIRATRGVLEGGLNYMKNIVGQGTDIDNIILVGGGASVYRKMLETFYPNHKLVVLEDGQFANVKGFYQAGLGFALSCADEAA